MADTLGSIIDKLITVDMKMWNNQEFLYEVRKSSFDEFKEKYTSTEEKQQDLFTSIKKCCDLNAQRNVLIDEVDEKIVKIIKDAISGKDIDLEGYIQKKHKTY
jgi:hypothetical protein|tara:strand:+ start:874 stop:1182 length:309 start_codon:yes stop_codon:yes gene_type:complete